MVNPRALGAKLAEAQSEKTFFPRATGHVITRLPHACILRKQRAGRWGSVRARPPHLFGRDDDGLLALSRHALAKARSTELEKSARA